ncbi:DUF3891 family protein [Bacillus sp. FJAT-45350]|uniref:DUF3891 family protein n=1 Tax=Bacillus sp. FJAT-45350 TaxID=2011014 RepID=UPI00211D10C1|nr:DUF3891 family protein [Bacillus sp. FJAT-45350]
MILREKANEYIIYEQHHHAFLSGEMAKKFNRNLLKSTDFYDELVLAVYEHDRSWKGLDETLIWNDEKHVPYSFIDYPLILKLAFYKIAIDEVQQMSPYAALLCSMHYCSFFKQSNDKSVLQFLQKENKRQLEIKNQLVQLDEALLLMHFRLLQFCDDLSLYLCLNERGIDKENEHPWFQNGMANSETLSKENKRLNAQWLNENTVAVHSFPFQGKFHLKVQYKSVPKKLVREKGIAKAFYSVEYEEAVIKITDKEAKPQ